METCDVKLYSLSTCIHCKDTKEFLNKCGVDYDCTEVDKLDLEQRRQVIEDLKKVNPGCAFPMIVIGAKVIIGFQKEELKEVLGIT